MKISGLSQACENNKGPILAELTQIFAHTQRVLEIGSGTGQHALHFAAHLPHLLWQTSDLAYNHALINQVIGTAEGDNILPPLALDLEHSWPLAQVDGIFTANTLHIVSEELVRAFFHGVQRHLSRGGNLCIYGPFNYNGTYTSESNARFDASLRGRDPQSGLREQQWVVGLAEAAGLELCADIAMPANNRLLHFIRR
ncbi:MULTISPECIES: DUF938 domain-containing protein [unclassified Pseudoalteromonas]|uniref:DUF938 domain-containing protein n=1 Tax=unclassified Pseudoalteromonas TaxID=194690 RepID=UPI000CF656BA|nr:MULTISPECIES: DUF938 domain-containing protein [unclassified Pseudoalteromonas]MBS3797057.1 DUF938 domain-containing protein [Pseudoalteromonas sp. BDTF-M6]